MAFMIPTYSDQPFAHGDVDGETVIVPWEFRADQEWDSPDDGETNPTKSEGWFCQLSAPGYLDCTDWEGSFATLELAREHIVETFEVHPTTGDELPTMENTKCLTWSERGDSHVNLVDAMTEQKTIFELRDSDVTEAVENGFLRPGDLHASMLEYWYHLEGLKP